ncbi:MAG: hypothetical protein R3B51_05390 [Thermodesulfobacteriota bacterium]
MDINESLKNACALRQTSDNLLDLGDAGVGNLRAGRQDISNANDLSSEIVEGPLRRIPQFERSLSRVAWPKGRTR